MITPRHPWRPATLAVALAATAALSAFGSASASAATETAIWSSGATIQNQLQSSILIKDWSFGSDITWTSTSAGDAFAEFGNTTGKLDETQDPTADKAGPWLDAYVATDSAPTGPLGTSGTNLYEAEKASGTDEVTVPVAQTPIDIVLSLPSGLSVTGKVDLTNQLVSEAFAGTVPADGSYAKNTWGALLSLAGNTISGTGGSTTITVEVRKNGAGATQTLKDYLFAVDTAGSWSDWASPILDDSNAIGTDEWPSGATITPAAGNSSDTTETTAVWNTPGTIGYVTAGDAASQGFTNKETTGGDSQNVLYAKVQDNGVSATPEYGDPENGSAGNVYTGNVEIAGVSGTSGDPESWTVPFSTGTTFNPDGSWNPSEPDDASIGSSYYPIVAALYELGWASYSGLTSDYSNAANSGYTAQQFLEFATGSTAQGDVNSNDYYAKLPSNILPYAQDAAAAVD